ncbi:MAG: methyltransferase [Victivallaceae bacterium]|jgi:hypothetical protein
MNGLIFEKQWLHALLLAVLLAGLFSVSGTDCIRAGSFWGLSSTAWFWLAAATAAAHQIFVWFCWRTQLHLSLLTGIFGKRGFAVYASVFAALGILRVIFVFMLAFSNRNTLHLNETALRSGAVVMLIPAIYLLYSVKRYFTFKRALGIDHFDASYRSMPFVREGIFRFTGNGMYTFGFFLLWVPGLWYASAAALVLALFNHIYIWVHYYSTELPDIRRIYGADKTGA